MTSIKKYPIFDVIKGVAILFMIIGHYVSSGPIRTFIFSFHMPLFFIMAGFLSSSFSSSCNKDIKSIICAQGRRLLLPYLLTQLVIFGFAALISLHRHNCGLFLFRISSAFWVVPINGLDESPIWFCLSLFWTHIFYFIICTLLKSGGGEYCTLYFVHFFL